MNEELIKATATEYQGWTSTLKEAVRVLLKAKIFGENIYIDFNGHRLYSLLDDENSCFMKVLGKSKQQREENRIKWLENYEKEQEENKKQAERKIPAWIERGNKLIYPQRQETWKDCVKIRAHDLYNGMELDNALDTMECLENGGTIEEANKILEDANHSGMSYGITLSIIVSFSKRGPEFYKAVRSNLTPEQASKIAKIQRENEIFEQELLNPEQE